MADVSLDLLTDEAILDYTTGNDGINRVLTSQKDINLNVKVRIQPVTGGVYDVDIFGSPIVDSCVCGKIRQPSNEPCPCCNARVYTKEEALRRFARIELPFYYLNEMRFDVFKELFDEIFGGTKIKYDFLVPDDFRKGGWGKSKKKLGIKAFDTCEFTYSKAKNTLTISEVITNEKKCSYEGLLAIIENHFPQHLVNYKKLINRYYLVQPSLMRPFTVSIKNKKRILGSHKLSVWYSLIIRFCVPEANDANAVNFKDVMDKITVQGERVRYVALLRAFINAGKKEATELLNTSKQNLARNLYSVRTKSSARCPIIPSTELAIDEISIPIHIAYEMCRAGFIEHLQKELNFTRKEAIRSTREEYNNPETLKMFKEYAEKQIVLTDK